MPPATPARDAYLALGEVVVCTRGWELRRRDGGPWTGAPCEPLPLRLLAILAERAGHATTRDELARAWDHRPDARALNNAVGKALRWAEDLSILRRSAARATRGVYRVEWLHAPAWSASAPWDADALLGALRDVLRGSVVPTYVTAAADAPVRMRLVWANPAFTRLMGWDSCEGKVVQDVFDRLFPAVAPELRARLEAEQLDVLRGLERGVDFHRLGPFEMDLGRLGRFVGGDDVHDERFEVTAFAHMVRSGTGERVGALVQYIVTRAGDPGPWWLTLVADPAFVARAWPGSEQA